MPFNAETYRLNQYRKARDANMAQARDIRRRTLEGTAYEWEARRIPTLVMLARCDNRLALSQRRFIAITKAAQYGLFLHPTERTR